MDYKAEWCKALGLRIENIKGDGNCLYTSLGKALEMNDEYINFLGETADKKQWGGARQVAISARMENVRVDTHSYGKMVQTYDYDIGEEQNNITISVLWCNI
eukprot:3894471-Heterocapsa_arctica.AAC.1